MAEFSFDDGNEGAGTAGPASGGGAVGPGPSGPGSPPSGSGGEAAGVGGSPASAADAPVRKRRGRPPKSDAQRAADAAARAGTGADKGSKEGVDLGFKKNDKAKVQQNIAGMHMMAAILTKQPVMALTEAEAKNLSAAVCDVADYHKISLDGSGGPLSLYLALATTAYAIYVPRIVALKSLKEGESIVGFADAPPTPGEAQQRASKGAGAMDFSGDIASTVN